MSDGEPTLPDLNPPEVPPAGQRRLDLPAGISRLAWLCTVTSALLLTAVLAGNALLLLLGVRPTFWLLALVDIGPLIAVFLGNIAAFAGYYGAWRIVRGLDEYDVAGDAKNQVAQVPGMLQDLPAQLRRRLGCLHSAALVTFVVAVAVSAATLAPPPFHTLGVALGSAPTATATSGVNTGPPPTVGLQVTPTSATQQCDTTGGLQPLTIALDNHAGASAVDWSIAITDLAPGVGIVWASAQPGQGQVGAGATGTVTLTPTSRLCYTLDGPRAFTATLTAQAGASVVTETITDTITPLSASPTSFVVTANQDMKQTCFSQGAASYVITLDNSAGGADITWSAASFDAAAGGAPWATASPASGVVPAGGAASVTITPGASACQIAGPTAWHAQIAYSAAGTAVGYLALTDTLSPFVIG